MGWLCGSCERSCALPAGRWARPQPGHSHRPDRGRRSSARPQEGPKCPTTRRPHPAASRPTPPTSSRPWMPPPRQSPVWAHAAHAGDGAASAPPGAGRGGEPGHRAVGPVPPLRAPRPGRGPGARGSAAVAAWRSAHSSSASAWAPSVARSPPGRSPTTTAPAPRPTATPASTVTVTAVSARPEGAAACRPAAASCPAAASSRTAATPAAAAPGWRLGGTGTDGSTGVDRRERHRPGHLSGPPQRPPRPLSGRGRARPYSRMTDTTGQAGDAGWVPPLRDRAGGDAQTERLTMLLDVQAAQPAVIRLRDWAFERLAPAPGETAARRRLRHGANTERLAARSGRPARRPGSSRTRRCARSRPAERMLRARPPRSSTARPRRCRWRTPRSTCSSASGCCSTSTTRMPRCASSRACSPGGRVALLDSDWATASRTRSTPRCIARYRAFALTQWPNPFSGRLLRVSGGQRASPSTPTSARARWCCPTRPCATAACSRCPAPGRGGGRGP